jgi:hypothetical protein
MMAKGKNKPPKTAAVLVETPERARHAAAIVDRPTGVAIGSPVGRLVQSPIDRLAGRGSISRRMHTAGQMLRSDFEIGVLGAKDIDGEMPPGIRSSVTVTPSEAQIDAMTNYKRAVRCLGVHVGAVVVATCCYERDVSIVAGQMGQDRHEVMGVLKACLKTLADHYRLTGADDHAQNVDVAARRVA